MPEQAEHVTEQRNRKNESFALAGDSAAVMIGFDGGVRGFWNSTANLNLSGSVYGLQIECEKALIQLRTRGEVRNENDKLETPPDIFIRGQAALISRVASMKLTA